MHVLPGYAFVCVYVCYNSARAKVLTSIKYTITLYMYINMRNRGSILGVCGGGRGRCVCVCVSCV